MHYQTLLLLATLSTSVLANPSLKARDLFQDCNQLQLTCSAAPGANQSFCASKRAKCDSCWKAYQDYVTSPGSNKAFAGASLSACIEASSQGDGSGVTPIISSLEAAIPSATTSIVSSTTSAPGTTPTLVCEQEIDCSAPDADQETCGLIEPLCEMCNKAFFSYQSTPGSNKSFGAATRDACFRAAEVGHDAVAPIITSFSLAQAGLTATRTTSTSSSTYTSSVATTTTESRSTSTTTTYASPANGTYPPPAGSPAAGGSPPSTTVIIETPGAGSSGAGTPPVVNATAPGSNLTTGPTPTSTPFHGDGDTLKPIGVLGALLLGATFMI